MYHIASSGLTGPVMIIITHLLISPTVLKPDSLVRCHGERFQAWSIRDLDTQESVIAAGQDGRLSFSVQSFEIFYESTTDYF